ncbi:MAG: fibrobacter succinogenes major paralogous domain-containing protein [Cyclobacterium sp.]|uniref:fibrobacter succinogenes major paralogous domain-containing protein n=1 Tax=Cyclobacterium sp. TaxID=1966343 RepID=UPI003970B78F
MNLPFWHDQKIKEWLAQAMGLATVVLFLLTFLGLYSCETDQIDDQPAPPPVTLDGGTEIFHIYKFQVPDLPEDQSAFTGTLGDQMVHLGRYTDDSLVFIIPIIPEGNHLLSVNIAGEKKRWSLDIRHPILEINLNDFYEDLMGKTNVLLSQAETIESLSELSSEFESWINTFQENLHALSDQEKTTVLGAMQQFTFRQLFQTDQIDLLQLDNVENLSSGRATLDFHNNLYDLQQLAIMNQFPDQRLYSTMTLGLGMGLWYRNVLNEYLSHKILEFPMLRDISLYKIDSVDLAEEPTEKLFLESGEHTVFSLYAHYQNINEQDLGSEASSSHHDFAEFIANAAPYKIQSVQLINSYLETYSLSLSDLASNFIHTLPPHADRVQSKLTASFSVAPRTEILDESTFRIREFDWVEGVLQLMVESLTGNAVEFPLEVLVENPQYQFFKQLSVIVQVSCPIIFQFVIEEDQPSLDMTFGTPPYVLHWLQGTGSENLSDLPPGQYEVEVEDALGCKRSLSFTIPEFGTVADIEGNEYRTVRIGEQWWMAENLSVGKFNDGTPIEPLESSEEWVAFDGPGYSWYDYDQEAHQNYGKLYNAQTACCAICPEGWRLPTIDDWTQLSHQLDPFPAGKLKPEKSWNEENLDNTNSSGFSALPAGGRKIDGSFFGKGDATFYLTLNSNNNLADDLFPTVGPGKNGFGFLLNMPDFHGFPQISTTAYSNRCIKE